MTRILRHRLTAAIGTVPVARGVAQAQPFASGSIDSVVSTFPSEYILDPKTLSEIDRTLRPGGCLVIVTGAWPKGPRGGGRLGGWVFCATGAAPGPRRPSA